MTVKTAEKYNALLKRTQKPLTITRTGDGYGYDHMTGGTNAELRALDNYIDACRDRVAADAIAEDLRNAAAHSRPADPFIHSDPGVLIGFAQQNGHDSGAAGIALRMVKADIDNEIARLNAVAIDRFEAYRTACAQGVAIPPVEEVTNEAK